MKKRILFILAIIMILSLIGCKPKSEEKEQKKMGLEMKAVENTVDYYMKELSKGNYEQSKKLYAPEFAQNSMDKIDTNLKINGYKIIESMETGEAGYVKVRITKMDISKPECSLDEDVFKVVNIKNEYKISEINNTSIAEIFMEKNNLRFKNKNEVKTNLVIYRDSIPKYAFAKDDKSSINKISLINGNFNMVNLSFSGDRLVLSMGDDYAYIGIVNIDQSLGVIGDQEEGANQQQDAQQGGNGTVREKPIGKDLITLDVLKKAKTEFMMFSPDQRFVLIQYNGDKDIKCIRIYDSDTGSLIPFKFEENYNINEVNITFTFFDKDIVNYEVTPKANKEENQKNVIGKWQLNLEDFKAKKQ